MPKKINLKLYDMDGCLFNVYPKGNVNNWLIASNKDFLAQQAQDIQAGHYDESIIGCGSSRQDFNIDHINATMGPCGSFAPVLPILQSYFSSQFNTETTIDPFLMADIYGDKRAGESYKQILQFDLDKKLPENASEWVFDDSKISLIYAHAHRVANLHPDAENIVIDFYDDRDDILKTNYDFYHSAADMLPKNVTLRLHSYCGEGPALLVNEVTGTGNIDTRYEWSIRYMAAKTFTTSNQLSPFFHNKQATHDRELSTANELLNFHNNNRYHAKGHETAMNGSLLNKAKFAAFRATELPQLITNTAITQTANYTNATQLFDAGLIPVKYNLSLKNKMSTGSNTFVKPSIESSYSLRPR